MNNCLTCENYWKNVVDEKICDFCTACRAKREKENKNG